MDQEEYHIIDGTDVDSNQQLQSSLLSVGPNAVYWPIFPDKVWRLFSYFS